jgi:hypothetical protein
MIEPQVPQDRVTIQPDNQELFQNKSSIPAHNIQDFRWARIIGITVLLFFVTIVAWIVVSDGGKFMASVFANLTSWFDQATIDPHDSKGFTSFIKLTLTAGFIALILYFICKK